MKMDNGLGKETIPAGAGNVVALWLLICYIVLLFGAEQVMEQQLSLRIKPLNSHVCFEHILANQPQDFEHDLFIDPHLWQHFPFERQH